MDAIPKYRRGIARPNRTLTFPRNSFWGCEDFCTSAGTSKNIDYANADVCKQSKKLTFF